ncbi:MAG: hypothetical protein U0174_06170 [Polyangiaceae bacterium]
MTETLVATYHPAEIRTRTRILLSLGGAIVSLFCMFFGIAMLPDGFGGLLALAGWLLLPVLTHVFFMVKPRPRARVTRVECHPGHVRLGSGVVFKPADVIGASTTRHEGKYLVHLYIRGASAPHAFTFDSEEAVGKFRKSLGLKHDGTGTLEWAMSKGSELWLGVIAGIASLLCGLSSAFLLLWTFLSYRSLRGTRLMAMSSEGLFIPPIAGHVGTHIRFADIASVEVVKGGSGLLLMTTAGHPIRLPSNQISDVEWARIAAQLEAASRRARGERTERERPIERVMQIQRADGEPIGSWLARLEAASLHSDYRGGALDPTELMRVTEDLDEAPLNRLAAARLLRRTTEEGRVRIDEALANIPVPERLVRIALESEGGSAAEAFAEVNATVLRRRTLG